MMGHMGLGDSFISIGLLFGYVVIPVLFFVILYFVVKTAVKNGIKEAWKERDILRHGTPNSKNPHDDDADF